MAAKKRELVTVNFPPDVREKLDAYAKRMAAERQEILVRLVRWWQSQEPTVQAAIVEQLPKPAKVRVHVEW